MTARPAMPARAYYALVDALEALEYDHPACPRHTRETCQRFTHHGDGRTVIAWTHQPACLREEMRAREVTSRHLCDLRPHWEPPTA